MRWRKAPDRPWPPHDGGSDYARARVAGVNWIIDNIGTYGYWNYN
jgi:membrane dipeptidase